MIDRREFLMAGGALAFAAPVTAFPQSAQRGAMQSNITDPFWPDNARLVISISMQMEPLSKSTQRWQTRLSSVATNQPVTARPGRRSIP